MNDSPDNHQSLCKMHHDKKTAQENGSFGRWTMTPTWLLNSTKPLIVVCGPPGAGKTTYVARKAKPADLVLDLDAIAVDLGMNPWTMTGSQIGRAIAERNNRLSDFVRGNTPHSRCWLIATAGTLKERLFWEDKGAELVLLNPGPTVCKQRIRGDLARPEDVKRKQADAVDRWGRE